MAVNNKNMASTDSKKITDISAGPVPSNAAPESTTTSTGANANTTATVSTQTSSTEAGSTETTAPVNNAATPGQTTINSSKVITRLTEGLEPVKIDRIEKYDKQPMVDMATQKIEAAREQYNNKIDNATNQGVTELRRALNDAQSQYEEQQRQIVADEMAALDNSALYAEARGDKGGIGQAQYNSIQNTAAQNKQAVRSAQTKLATDTARQIGDLRAQGEFDKADAMLELTQTYLAELQRIEEFAVSHNLSVDQINTAISQWEADYAKGLKEYITSVEMSVAGMTGAFGDGTPTIEALTANNQNLAEIALSLLGAGMSADKLTPEQKAALEGVYGMDEAQIEAYAKLTTKKSGGSYSGTPESPVYIDENGNPIVPGVGDSATGTPPLSEYLDVAAAGATRQEIIDSAIAVGASPEEAAAKADWAMNK